MRQGHVYKRGSTWTYVVDVSAPGSPRRQLSKGGFAKKADALGAMGEAQRAVATGSYVEPATLTVAEFLRDEWLPAMEATGNRPTTLRSYRMHLERHIAPRIGDDRIQGRIDGFDPVEVDLNQLSRGDLLRPDLFGEFCRGRVVELMIRHLASRTLLRSKAGRVSDARGTLLLVPGTYCRPLEPSIQD